MLDHSFQPVYSSALTSTSWFHWAYRSVKGENLRSPQFFSKHVSFSSPVCGFLDSPVYTQTFQNPYFPQKTLDFSSHAFGVSTVCSNCYFLPRKQQFVHLPFNNFRGSLSVASTLIEFEVTSNNGKPFTSVFQGNLNQVKNTLNFFRTRTTLLLPEAVTYTGSMACHL